MSELREWRKVIVGVHQTVEKRWEPWSDEDKRFLALALCGEVGELANLIKKTWRDGDKPEFFKAIREEMADVRIYLELLAEAYDVDLDAASSEITHEKIAYRWPIAYKKAIRNTRQPAREE